MSDLNVDTLIAEATYQPYVVTIGGRDYTIPHMKTLPAGDLMLVVQQDSPLDMLRLALGEENAEAVVPLPLFALEAIVDGWQRHCGITVGESEASSGS